MSDEYFLVKGIFVHRNAGNNNMSPEYLTRAIRQYLPQYEIPFSAYHRMNVFTSDGTPFR